MGVFFLLFLSEVHQYWKKKKTKKKKGDLERIPDALPPSIPLAQLQYISLGVTWGNSSETFSRSTKALPIFSAWFEDFVSRGETPFLYEK